MTADYEFCVDWLLEKGHIKNTDRIATIGFCWGGWVTFQLSSKQATKYPLKAGTACHPSPMVEQIFGRDLNAYLGKIDCPQFMASAGNDHEVVKPGGEVEKVLQKKGLECEIMLFESMAHGWVLRGDLENEEVKKTVKEALEGLAKFLNKNL